MADDGTSDWTEAEKRARATADPHYEPTQLKASVMARDFLALLEERDRLRVEVTERRSQQNALENCVTIANHATEERERMLVEMESKVERLKVLFEGAIQKGGKLVEENERLKAALEVPKDYVAISAEIHARREKWIPAAESCLRKASEHMADPNNTRFVVSALITEARELLGEEGK